MRLFLVFGEDCNAFNRIIYADYLSVSVQLFHFFHEKQIFKNNEVNER